MSDKFDAIDAIAALRFVLNLSLVESDDRMF